MFPSEMICHMVRCRNIAGGNELFGVKSFHTVCIVIIDDIGCEEGVANNQKKFVRRDEEK